MKYFERIDGLRFIAIFLVLVAHFAVIIGNKINAGFYGVDLFFVISGFLITSILIKETSKKFSKSYLTFIGRRTFRIFPIYYLMIFILWILNLHVIREHLIWFITYTFNYAWVIFQLPNTPVSHFWSLGVEEQFYLFSPLIILFLKSKPKILTVLIIIIILFGYAQYVFNIIPSIGQFNEVGILTRMSSLGLGALGAILVKQNMLPNKIFNNIIIEILIIFILFFILISQKKWQYPLLGLISLFFVIKASCYHFNIKIIDSFLQNKIVVRLGGLAYGIYIYHLPLEYYLTKFLFDPLWLKINFASFGKFQILQWNSWIIKFPIYSIISIYIAWISYRYIEEPILKLKNKYFKY